MFDTYLSTQINIFFTDFCSLNIGKTFELLCYKVGISNVKTFYVTIIKRIRSIYHNILILNNVQINKHGSTQNE